MKRTLRDFFCAKYFTVILSLLLIICTIIVNSLYIDGMFCSEISCDDGDIGKITNGNGYLQQENKFSYNLDKECYFKIPYYNSANEIIFYFADSAKKDVNVKFGAIGNGKITNKENQNIKWKKNSIYFKVNVNEGSCEGYYVAIPASFKINSVFYACNNKSIISIKQIYILSVLFSFVFSLILQSFNAVRKIIDNIEVKIIKTNKTIINKLVNAKKYILVVCLNIFLIIFGMSINYKFNYNYKQFIFSLCVLGLIELFIFKKNYFGKKIEIIGFLIILTIGSTISFLEPSWLGMSWDDGTHYNRTVTLSHIIDNKQSLADWIIREDEIRIGSNREKYNKEFQKSYIDFLDEIENNQYYTFNGGLRTVLSSFSCISYIPAAIGIFLARGIGLPYHIQFIAGKWMNALLFGILCYYSMKKLKSGKLLVLLIALIPTNIFLASNYSYDTWLTGWSMLGLCTFFGEIQRPDDKITKKSKWTIFISMLLAVMPKMVYFPLIFIVFFMPKYKFSSKKDYCKYKLLIAFNIAIPFLLVLFGNVLSSVGTTGRGDLRGGEGVDAGGQIAFIMQNPVQAARIILNFLKTYLNPFAEGKEYINNWAYNGYILCYEVVLVTIIISAVVSREEKEPGKYVWWFRSGVILVYIGIGLLAAMTMYISFTAVGSTTVAGCQGRYIIPAIFPTLFVLTRFSGKTYVKDFMKEENINMIALGILVLFNIYGLWINYVNFY